MPRFHLLGYVPEIAIYEFWNKFYNANSFSFIFINQLGMSDRQISLNRIGHMNYVSQHVSALAPLLWGHH